MTKRQNIEFLLGWLDALRRKDLSVVAGAMAPDLVWQGLRPELACRGVEDVVQMFLERRAEGFDIDALELIGAESGAILCVRIPGGVELDGERIGPVEDYLDRGEALAAAGLA